MLASINPLGERARRTRWARTVAWYTLGSAAGGAAVGAACGFAGRLVHEFVAPSPTGVGLIVLASCVVGLVLDVGAAGARVPSRRRQVNEDWLDHYRGWVYGTGFGFQLGTGLATTVTTAAVYVLLVLAIFSGSIGRAVVIGTTFGIVRAVPILAVAHAHDPERLRRVLARAHALAGPSRVAVVGCLFLVGATSLATLAG